MIEITLIPTIEIINPVKTRDFSLKIIYLLLPPKALKTEKIKYFKRAGKVVTKCTVTYLRSRIDLL
jgi:hypothetical protein